MVEVLELRRRGKRWLLDWCQFDFKEEGDLGIIAVTTRDKRNFEEEIKAFGEILEKKFPNYVGYMYVEFNGSFNCFYMFKNV